MSLWTETRKRTILMKVRRRRETKSKEKGRKMVEDAKACTSQWRGEWMWPPWCLLCSRRVRKWNLHPNGISDFSLVVWLLWTLQLLSNCSFMIIPGMSGSLLWLQNCLYKTATDREKDGKSVVNRRTHLRVVVGVVAKWFINHASWWICLFSAGFSHAVPLFPLSEADEEAMENRNFLKLLRKIGIRAPANEQVCVCVVHFTSGSIQYPFILTPVCRFQFRFQNLFFLGDLLENPSKDQRIAAPECSCCPDFSTRRSRWWWEAKRHSSPGGGGGGGRGGNLERWESSGSQEEEPHLWSHRWAGGSHVLCPVSDDSC